LTEWTWSSVPSDFFDTSARWGMKGLRSLTMIKDRMNACMSLMSTLLVAAVVVTGLASLSAQNLSGNFGAHQFKEDHSVAIQKLMFRG
jgi:hypothetical protein